MNQHISGSLLIKTFLHSHDRIDDSLSGWSDTDHKPLNENDKGQKDRQDSQDQLQKKLLLAAYFVHATAGVNPLIEGMPHRFLKDGFTESFSNR